MALQLNEQRLIQLLLDEDNESFEKFRAMGFLVTKSESRHSDAEFALQIRVAYTGYKKQQPFGITISEFVRREIPLSALAERFNIYENIDRMGFLKREHLIGKQGYSEEDVAGMEEGYRRWLKGEVVVQDNGGRIRMPPPRLSVPPAPARQRKPPQPTTLSTAITFPKLDFD